MVLLWAALSPGAATAGPWTPAPKAGYAKAWLRWLPGFGYHDGAGETISYGSYHELSVNLYGELGLWARGQHLGLALTLNAPLVQAFVLQDPRNGGHTLHVQPGDPTLGLRFRFLQSWLVAALEAGTRFPLASDAELQQVYADDKQRTDPNERIGALRAGTGVFDFPVGLALGHGWGSGFLEASIGYVPRTGGYKHDVYWTLGAGQRLSKSFTGRVRLSGRHATEIGGDAPRHESPSGIGNGTSYVGFALEVDYQLSERWALTGALEGGLGALRRQTGGPVLTFGVAARL